MSATIEGPDGLPRCRWCAAAPEFLHYHDREWGFPVDDDRRLFEKLSLEGFQSGLSWRTILAKRENFRAAFDGFDFGRVARYTGRDVERLLADAGIVRHRGKIEAVIHNAGRACELVRREGSLAAFFWRFEPDPATLAAPQTASTSPGSVAIDGNHVWVSNWAIETAAGPGAGEPKLGSTVGVVDIDATTHEIIHRVRSADTMPAALTEGAGPEARPLHEKVSQSTFSQCSTSRQVQV